LSKLLELDVNVLKIEDPIVCLSVFCSLFHNAVINPAIIFNMQIAYLLFWR